MLRKIFIAGFKCFEDLKLDVAPLTLLSGINGGGKSSIIQALALLAQTLRLREWGRTLLLDGPELALGNAADVLNQRSTRRRFALGAATDDEEVLWEFKADDRRALSVELEGVLRDGQQLEIMDPTRWLLPSGVADSSEVVRILRRVSWVGAERSGPRELLPLRDQGSEGGVGHKGELAAGLLHWREGDAVSGQLCLPDTPPTLFHQVRARMQEFFPRCDLRVHAIEGASAVALQMRTDPRSGFQRPQNVGFGLSQVFPLIVAVLTAREGDLLMIENPEVHLHPRAQQLVGHLLAQTAATGVQIIVESHSDHLLNGVRLGVKTGTMPCEDVAVHYFAPGDGDGGFLTASPRIDPDGRFDTWPDGFFDQYDAALSKLL